MKFVKAVDPVDDLGEGCLGQSPPCPLGLVHLVKLELLPPGLPFCLVQGTNWPKQQDVDIWEALSTLLPPILLLDLIPATCHKSRIPWVTRARLPWLTLSDATVHSVL